MIRRFHRPIATYLSTNHPVLWVTRMDVAVVMAIVVGAVSVPIVLAANAIKVEWGVVQYGPVSDLVAECRISSKDQNILYALQVFTLGLGAAAALVWFGAVYRSAYKAVALEMRIYPRVVELFAALAILGLAAATAAIAVEFVMNRGECPLVGQEIPGFRESDPPLRVAPPPFGQPQPMAIVGRYLGFLIEP